MNRHIVEKQLMWDRVEAVRKSGSRDLMIGSASLQTVHSSAVGFPGHLDRVKVSQ
jgi:hypothetical protein